MAERKAVNKYYPPEWSPSKGSINKFRKSHPLRDRARKLHKGIMIVRFELPYNIWCEGCGSHVAMGVRYNAEKSRTGFYYTTPIYKFRMKCHLCDSHFEIQTDPKNFDYEVISGASRKNERWNHVEGETIAVGDSEEKEKINTDPMYALEHVVDDKTKGESYNPSLKEIYRSSLCMDKDYAVNSLIRKHFRGEKRELQAQEKIDQALKEKCSIDIPLLPENPKDIKLAKTIKFGQIKKRKKIKLKSQNIFGKIRNGKFDKFQLIPNTKSATTSPSISKLKKSELVRSS
ncbi:coiled-coil domain-containing protein [Oopsacas minuta]|uniref:Coiled-coil domain-containing protein n=1 Tax=Oopsacas minuta TaxID=111878 RepID=A0AAV7K7F0_9METZ|nr:coiled-coil domain-containing protein [Oopsacas minuta]